MSAFQGPPIGGNASTVKGGDLLRIKTNANADMRNLSVRNRADDEGCESCACKPTKRLPEAFSVPRVMSYRLPGSGGEDAIRVATRLSGCKFGAEAREIFPLTLWRPSNGNPDRRPRVGESEQFATVACAQNRMYGVATPLPSANTVISRQRTPRAAMSCKRADRL